MFCQRADERLLFLQARFQTSGWSSFEAVKTTDGFSVCCHFLLYLCSILRCLEREFSYRVGHPFLIRPMHHPLRINQRNYPIPSPSRAALYLSSLYSFHRPFCHYYLLSTGPDYLPSLFSLSVRDLPNLLRLTLRSGM